MCELEGFQQDKRFVVNVMVTNRPESFSHGGSTLEESGWAETEFDVWTKAYFVPRVDQLALLQTSKSTLNWTKTPQLDGLSVYLQIGTDGDAVKSSRKLYWQGDYIVGSFAAMIRVEEGVIQSIQWIDGCRECGEESCVDESCAIHRDVCEENEEYGSCDIKIYLAWIGTDRDGNRCTSAGRLPSNFRLFSLTPAYEQASFLNQYPNVFF
eukprot:TRINITY_DN15221_c0_g1_i1.p1 TRINITY_DN15221_c0_g1~~TRINITY_DN15221_c0_g1_i1.p1  ORF type:complete len:229 (-),score=36.67 TRINITY_DN15221_c0_g1_i1:59-688(-)